MVYVGAHSVAHSSAQTKESLMFTTAPAIVLIRLSNGHDTQPTPAVTRALNAR